MIELMRAAPDMHVEWVEDEAVVLNVPTGEIHYLSPSAALTLALVAEHGFDAGLERLRELRDVSSDDARTELQQLLDELIAKGLLVGD